LFREGFRGIHKHGFMSFAAICVMVACLVIIGGFAMISYNLQCMVSEMEQESQIMVYIDETYTTAEAKSVGTQLSQIKNIKSKEFVTRQEALTNYANIHDDPSAFDGIDASTFRDRFVVTLEDNTKLDQTTKEMEAVEGVAEVKSPKDIINGFNTIQNMLNIASAAIIVVLLVVSLFIISNTIKLVMYDRRDEIGIMKMVGATNGFIRFPFVVEGMILGLLGSGIAFALEWGLYDLIGARIAAADSLDLFSVVPFTDVVWFIAVAFGVTGLLIGVVGSLISIRKFMDV
jgi:cell division transport system permease protein